MDSEKDELPEGWERPPFSGVAKARMGPTILAKDLSSEGLPVYSAGQANVAWGYTTRDVPVFSTGTVVVSARGSIGFPKIPKEASFTSTQTTIAITPTPAITSAYLQRFLQSTNWAELSSGAAIPMLTISMLGELAIPLAPLAEQKRIADKLEAVLGRVDACRARLDRVPALLKRFRQSVLAAATSGRLTEDLRSGNPHEDLGHFRNLKGIGTKVAEPSAGHEILTSQFPKDWARTSFGELFRFIDYRGRNPNKAPSGKRLITAKNIKMGRVEDEPVEFISEQDYKAWMTRGFPKKGDILFVTEGHTMGCTALNQRDDEFALAQRTITLQPFAPLETGFFYFVMLSDAFQDLVRVNATGSAAQGLKAAKLRGLPLPFPTLPEQQEIVRRVEALFAFADRIEARLATARKTVERLTPATLAKAFRGELVPQDPNDEPASALLERLHAQSDPATAKPKRGRRAKSTSA